jgi:hypothetical protein
MHLLDGVQGVRQMRELSRERERPFRLDADGGHQLHELIVRPLAFSSVNSLCNHRANPWLSR